MPALAGGAGARAWTQDAGPEPIAGVDPVDWGLVLRSGSPLRRRLLRVAEAATGALGLALVLLAVAHWLLPGTIVSVGVAGHKAALTAFLVMSGLVLLRYAGQGFQTEVHLDRLRGELRIVACNRGGAIRLLDSLDFAEIAALEVARNGDGATRGRLLVHLVHGDAPLALVSGPLTRLSPVAAALAREIEQSLQHLRGPSGDLGRVAPSGV